MKRQKRYTTREAILKDIDRALRRHARIIARAAAQEAKRDLLKDAAPNDPEWRGVDEFVADLLAKAQRLKDTRLRKLQNVLAAYDTELLKIEGNVKQVVLEKL